MNIKEKGKTREEILKKIESRKNAQSKDSINLGWPNEMIISHHNYPFGANINANQSKDIVKFNAKAS